MTEMARKMRDKIVEVISRTHFQPGFPSWAEQHRKENPLPAAPGVSKTTTWCNEAANAVLVELGFDTRPILDPKGIGWTGATAMHANATAVARTGGAGVFEVSPRQAQAWANAGIPVLAAARNPKPGSSHVGIVAPTDDPWDAAAGPWIGQAGAKNGFRSAYESFTRWGLVELRYFIMPWRA